MTFSAISNFVSGDEAGMSRWLLEHYYEHMAMNQAAQGLGYPIPDYPIQTMGENVAAWLGGHQRIHQAIWTAVGGGVASDLSLVDWDNDDQVYDWLKVHATIHGDVRGLLGL